MKKHAMDRAARESIEITQAGFYVRGCGRVALPDVMRAGEVILVDGPPAATDGMRYAETLYYLVNADSFDAVRLLHFEPEQTAVHNFANALHPGGGFLYGAPAQEESLCRESTLYASLSSAAARPFYESHAQCRTDLLPDDMLFSPCVSVFKAGSGQLLPEPFTVGVFTLAAPDLGGKERRAPHSEVIAAMIRRLRAMLGYAAAARICNLVLGAWGCGAFGHDPAEVAALTYRVLVEEGWERSFAKIAFAIKGSADSGNLRAFQNAFRRELTGAILQEGSSAGR